MFSSDGVTVTLEWTQKNALHSYYISATPDLALWINGSANVNLKLKISYNTLYNVSIFAEPPCGGDNMIGFIDIFYSKFRLESNRIEI